MPAVFDPEYIRNIRGPNLKEARSKMEKAEMLMEDIRQFPAAQRRRAHRDDLVRLDRGFPHAADVHQSLKRFEYGLRENDPEIAPSQIYAYAALKMGSRMRTAHRI